MTLAPWDRVGRLSSHVIADWAMGLLLAACCVVAVVLAVRSPNARLHRRTAIALFCNLAVAQTLCWTFHVLEWRGVETFATVEDVVHWQGHKAIEHGVHLTWSVDGHAYEALESISVEGASASHPGSRWPVVYDSHDPRRCEVGFRSELGVSFVALLFPLIVFGMTLVYWGGGGARSSIGSYTR